MANTHKDRGVLALILLTLGFGLFAVVTRYFGEALTLFQQMYATFGIGFLASIVFFPRTLSLARLRAVPRRDWAVIFFRIAIGTVVATALYREAILIAKISSVAFLQVVPFVAFFGWLLFRDRFTREMVLWTLVSFLGAALVTLEGDFAGSVGTGEIFSIISGALFSVAFLARRWQSDHLSEREMAQLHLFIGFLVLFVLSLALGEGFPRALAPGMWAALVIGGFFLAINSFLVNYGFRHVPSGLANNLLTLEAIFGSVLGYLFFMETPSAIELFGGAIIVLSALAMHRSQSLIEAA